MIVQYLQRVQRILGDQRVSRFNVYDLVDYINEARGIVAVEGECVRVLCPSTAPLSFITVTAGGSGYTTAPAVTITPPGVGVTATAQAVIFGGAVAGVTVINPGSGYTTSTIPGVSFSGGSGTGATATATLAPFAQTVANQELYPFSQFNSLIVGSGTGADHIISIRSIAVSWGAMKPVLRRFSAWSDLQAYLRAYNVAAQGYPRAWAPYGMGSQGGFYLWPVPAQAAQIDLDCICVPQDLDLQSDAGLEPIPYPFTNAVPYKAAELAVLGEPDLRDLADRYMQHYQRRMAFASATAYGQSAVPDFYTSAARM